MADVVSFFTTNFLDLIDGLSAKLAQRVDPTPKGRVLLVPALPGSQLARRVDGHEQIVWAEIDSARKGLLLDLAASNPLIVQGLVEPVYIQLSLRLRLAGYEVVPYPYDWRKPVRSLGEDLAAFIREQGRPVDLVTHSYGGLVARAALHVGAPGVGQVIMLGTPNGGSFDVMQGIRGNHWVLHLLSAIDGRNSALTLGKVCFGSWPSVYECLPDGIAPGGFDAFEPSAWPRTGLLPHADLLAAGREDRAWLASAPHDDLRIHLIAGYGQPTSQRVEVVDDLLHYWQSNDGDGLVPLDRASLPGHPLYYTHCSHIGLPNHGEAISAIEDILAGRTPLLSTTPPNPSPCRRVREDELTEPSFRSRTGNHLGLADVKAILEEAAGMI